jgi:hypothetical protein
MALKPAGFILALFSVLQIDYNLLVSIPEPRAKAAPLASAELVPVFQESSHCAQALEP